jgi:DNA-binding response OmpR family regulator
MDGSTRKILLIEDNSGDAEFIGELLSEVEGSYRLTAADRPSSGLELPRKEGFALVLPDLGLPDSTGIDTFRA